MEYGPIMIDGCIVNKDSLRFEGKQVVDGDFKDGTPLNNKHLSFLTMMNEIEDLITED